MKNNKRNPELFDLYVIISLCIVTTCTWSDLCADNRSN